jgi:hypothetical protein
MNCKLEIVATKPSRVNGSVKRVTMTRNSKIHAAPSLAKKSVKPFLYQFYPYHSENEIVVEARNTMLREIP